MRDLTIYTRFPHGQHGLPRTLFFIGLLLGDDYLHARIVSGALGLGTLNLKLQV
jgi:hypothetical protein